MKEKIKKLLIDWLSNEPMTDEIAISQTAKEITALIQSEYVEKEFAIWCIINIARIYTGKYYFIEDEGDERKSVDNLEEVYDYWLKEVKGVKQ